MYPLLFLPLVENAFKYVGGDYHIRIAAQKKESNIEFEVENSVPAQNFSVSHGGIGLENLKRRLELLYPGKHEFETKKENNQFKAKLTLKFLSHACLPDRQV